jgi:hypothetical protein
MSEAKEGVWTPYGIVTCVICHGPEFPHKTFDVDSEEWERFKHPCELRKGKAVTLCHYCKTEIQVYETVAYENNLSIRFQAEGIDSNMAQTGGMNSACQVYTTDGGCYLITWDMDGDDKWWAIRYDHDENTVETYGFETRFTDDMFEYIVEAEAIKRI